MGMDIHLWVEKKHKGRWQAVEIADYFLEIGRCPYIFSLFGQGNMDDKAISSINFHERGIPPDTAFSLAELEKEKTFFGFTYAYLDELMQIDWDYSDRDADHLIWPLQESYFRSLVEHIIPRICEVSNDLEFRNVRVIIAFDH
jgi:hypothetical protein